MKNSFETSGGIIFKTDRKIEDNSKEIEKLEQEKQRKNEELFELFKRRDGKGISKEDRKQIIEDIKDKKREVTEIKNRINALKQKPIEEILESAGSVEKIAEEEKETPMPAVVGKEKEVKQEQPEEKEKSIEEDATEKESVKKKRRRKLKPKGEEEKEMIEKRLAEEKGKSLPEVEPKETEKDEFIKNVDELISLYRERGGLIERKNEEGLKEVGERMLKLYYMKIGDRLNWTTNGVDLMEDIKDKELIKEIIEKIMKGEIINRDINRLQSQLTDEQLKKYFIINENPERELPQEGYVKDEEKLKLGNFEREIEIAIKEWGENKRKLKVEKEGIGEYIIKEYYYSFGNNYVVLESSDPNSKRKEVIMNCGELYNLNKEELKHEKQKPLEKELIIDEGLKQFFIEGFKKEEEKQIIDKIVELIRETRGVDLQLEPTKESGYLTDVIDRYNIRRNEKGEGISLISISTKKGKNFIVEFNYAGNYFDVRERERKDAYYLEDLVNDLVGTFKKRWPAIEKKKNLERLIGEEKNREEIEKKNSELENVRLELAGLNRRMNLLYDKILAIEEFREAKGKPPLELSEYKQNILKEVKKVVESEHSKRADYSFGYMQGMMGKDLVSEEIRKEGGFKKEAAGEEQGEVAKEIKEESPEIKATRIKKELFENAGNKSKEELVQLISDVEKILDEEKEKGKGKLKDKISEIRDSEYGKEKFMDGHIVYLPKDGEAIFIGDTHGDPDAAVSVIEQEKFIEAMEKGEKNKYLVFLGDYVDRGEGDIENIEQIIALKKKYPDNVILLRGNHEGTEAAGDDFQISLLRRYGGKNLIESLGHYETSKTGEKSFILEKGWRTKIYSTENAVKELDQRYQKLFEKLPGVVVCGNGIVGVHGGIPNEDIKSLKDLNDPKKLYEMRWNDPYEGEEKRRPSERGEGITIFNKDAFSEFMKAVDGKVMARAHEYGVKKGCFDNKLLTVFSSGEGGEKSGYQNRVKPYYAKFNLGKDIEKIIGNVKGNEVRKVMYVKPNYKVKEPEKKEKPIKEEIIFGLEIKTREELEKMGVEELKKEGEGVFAKLEELKTQKDFEKIKETEEYKKLLEYGSLMVEIYDRKKEEKEAAGAKEKAPEAEKEITAEEPKKYKEILKKMENTVLALNIDVSKITPEEYGLAEKYRDGKLTKKEDIEKAENVVMRQDLPDRARIIMAGATLDSLAEIKDPKERAYKLVELRHATEILLNLQKIKLGKMEEKLGEAMLQGKLTPDRKRAIGGRLTGGVIEVATQTTEAKIVEEEKETEKKDSWAVKKIKGIFGLGKSPEEKKAEEDIKSQKNEIKTLEDELKASAGIGDESEREVKMKAVQDKIDLAKKKLKDLEAEKEEIKEKKEGAKSAEKELENRLSKAKEPKDLGEIIKDLFKNSKGLENKEALNEVLDKILERFSYKDDAEKSEKNKKLKEGLEFLKKSVEEGKLDYGSEFMNKFILKWLEKVEEMRKERLEGGREKKDKEKEEKDNLTLKLEEVLDSLKKNYLEQFKDLRDYIRTGSKEKGTIGEQYVNGGRFFLEMFGTGNKNADLKFFEEVREMKSSEFFERAKEVYEEVEKKEKIKKEKKENIPNNMWEMTDEEYLKSDFPGQAGMSALSTPQRKRDVKLEFENKLKEPDTKFTEKNKKEWIDMNWHGVELDVEKMVVEEMTDREIVEAYNKEVSLLEKVSKDKWTEDKEKKRLEKVLGSDRFKKVCEIKKKLETEKIKLPKLGNEEWHKTVSAIFNSVDIKNCKKEDLLPEMSNVKVRLSGEIQNNETAEFYHRLLSEVMDKDVDKNKIELKGGADLKKIRETLDSIGNEDAKNFFESVFERLKKNGENKKEDQDKKPPEPPERLEKKSSESDFRELFKGISGGMSEASIKQQEKFDSMIRSAIKDGKEDEAKRLKEKYYNYFEETWSSKDSNPKRYRETYYIKNELKKSLRKMEKKDLESLDDNLLSKLDDKKTIEEEIGKLSSIAGTDIKPMINEIIDFEKVKTLTVKEVREAIESVYREKKIKEQKEKEKKNENTGRTEVKV